MSKKKHPRVAELLAQKLIHPYDLDWIYKLKYKSQAAAAEKIAFGVPLQMSQTLKEIVRKIQPTGASGGTMD